MPDSTPLPAIKPTAQDREAAEIAYLECYEDQPNDLWLAALLAGKHDDDPLLQILARHASLARSGALEEAAGTVDAARAIYAARVTASGGDDGEASTSAWVAGQLRDAIRALIGKEVK